MSSIDIIIKITYIIMGNICLKQEDECFTDTKPKRRRSQFQSNLRISQKDLVQIKSFKITQQYTLITPPIGKGTFGAVYKVINRSSGMVRAAKKIPQTLKQSANLEQFYLLKKLDHPNIIRIIDIYVQEYFIFVVTEYCGGGQLFDRILQQKKLTQNTARNYMKQLLSAISYCHSAKIMHRDLKPQNIMFMSQNQNQLKIIDFGASTLYSSEQMAKAKVGSIFYIAPEVIKKEYNEKCDIWSLGVIMFIMLSGSPPFYGRTDRSIFKKILVGKYQFPPSRWNKISEEAKDLIRRMLQYEPQKRISARHALNHPWFFMKETKDENVYVENQLSSMMKFCNANKFQQSVMIYITHHLVTTQSLIKLQKKFKQLDQNLDGKISWAQFKKCYRQTMPALDDKQLQELFLKLDKNKSGFLDYSEFISSAIQNQQVAIEQLLQKAFNTIDRDHNGKLDKEQILFAFGGMNQELLDSIISQCDLNSDGLVSKQQFMKGMKGIQSKFLKSKSTTNTQEH